MAAEWQLSLAASTCSAARSAHPGIHCPHGPRCHSFSKWLTEAMVDSVIMHIISYQTSRCRQHAWRPVGSMMANPESAKGLELQRRRGDCEVV